MTENMDALSLHLHSIEQQLVELKKAMKESSYRSKRNEGLESALADKKEADNALQEELTKLGYSPAFRWDSWW